MGTPFGILTESSSDLTPALVERTGADVLPLTFTMEGTTYAHYPDGRNMSLKTFYEKTRQGVLSTTAAANVAELSEGMERHLRAGEDVLFLCFSSGLSSTRDACAMAAAELRERYPVRKIITVDTLSATGGQAFLILMAAELRQRGDTIEQVRDAVEAAKLHVAHWFTVDNLTYLKRGGRISPAVAAVGSMLQIKPILRVDDEGRLMVADKVRGRKASVQALLRRMEESAVRPLKRVIVVHADCPEEADDLREQVQARFSPEETLILPLGPVIGSHTGPGLIALIFLAGQR